MNPLFVATPSPATIAAALQLWPEVAGHGLRPLLVSAFGDIYVELVSGEVWAVQPLELSFERVASSVAALERAFSDSAWAAERLLTEVLVLARERGKVRAAHQVFAVTPHPRLGGTLAVDRLQAMDLKVWHHICVQFKPRV